MRFSLFDSRRNQDKRDNLFAPKLGKQSLRFCILALIFVVSQHKHCTLVSSAGLQLFLHFDSVVTQYFVSEFLFSCCMKLYFTICLKDVRESYNLPPGPQLQMEEIQLSSMNCSLFRVS